MSLWERIADAPVWARGVAVAAVWLGLSALFGGITVLDLVAVGVIVLVFVPASFKASQRRSAKDDDSLYGPRE